jgi:hypothetical protein
MPWASAGSGGAKLLARPFEGRDVPRGTLETDRRNACGLGDMLVPRAAIRSAHLRKRLGLAGRPDGMNAGVPDWLQHLRLETGGGSPP